MTLKIGMQHWVLEYYQVYSNDDPGMTTYFTARLNLVSYAFVWEKVKQWIFSETIVVYDIKVGRCSQLKEYMKLYEYQRSRSFINFFFAITNLPIKAKFYLESRWDEGTKACSKCLSHMTKMATMPIYGKIL